MDLLIFIIQFILWGLAFAFTCKILSIQNREPNISDHYCVYETEFKNRQIRDLVCNYIGNWNEYFKGIVNSNPYLIKKRLEIATDYGYCESKFPEFFIETEISFAFTLSHQQLGELGSITWNPVEVVRKGEFDCNHLYLQNENLRHSLHLSLIKAAKKHFENKPKDLV